MAIPSAAAVPAIPTKWPLPMLLAKRDAPICGVHSYGNHVLYPNGSLENAFDDKKGTEEAMKHPADNAFFFFFF